MVQVTSREFREKQAALFELADKGEQVIIRRRGKVAYMLTPIYDNDFVVTPELEKSLKKVADNIGMEKLFLAIMQKKL